MEFHVSTCLIQNILPFLLIIGIFTPVMEGLIPCLSPPTKMLDFILGPNINEDGMLVDQSGNKLIHLNARKISAAIIDVNLESKPKANIDPDNDVSEFEKNSHQINIISRKNSFSIISNELNNIAQDCECDPTLRNSILEMNEASISPNLEFDKIQNKVDDNELQSEERHFTIYES